MVNQNGREYGENGRVDAEALRLRVDGIIQPAVSIPGRWDWITEA
jgi:hypothetical protein